MRKLTLFIITLLVFATTAFAYEGNPDRYPSLGANLILGSGTGTYTLTNGGLSASQDLTATSSALVFDGRIPTSDNFTLNLGLALSGSTIKGDENTSFFASEQKSSSFNLNIGFRYYFH